MKRARIWFWATVLLMAPVPWSAAQIRNACPGGCGIVANPVFVNVYWDTSLSQWDQDEIAAGQPDLVSGRIDAFTRALTHSNYFAGLAGYGVHSATFLRSVAGDCATLPFTIQPPNNYLNKQMQALAQCVLAANPDLDPSTTILNVFFPPQVVPVSPTATYCTTFAGDHDQFWSGVEMTRIPTNPACNPSMGTLSLTLTHEMVEGATDVNVGSPWGWKKFGGGLCDEIGDFCACRGGIVATPAGFLYGTIAPYWVDGLRACWFPSLLSVPPGAAPTITLASVSGSGPSTVFTLTGPSLAGSAVGKPWDLASGIFGGQTLYLNALVAHHAQPVQAQWGAGNIEGLPRDQVGLKDIAWSDDGRTVNIKVAGFNGNYGQTLTESFVLGSLIRHSGGQVDAATNFPNTLVTGSTVTISGANPQDLNGTFTVIRLSPTAFDYFEPGAPDEIGSGGTVSTPVLAIIAPGDTVTFTYTDPLSGLSTTASGTTPFPAKITASLEETRPKHPTVQDGETFFGTVSDSLGGGMETLSVTCTTCAPPVNVQTAGGGLFLLSVTPPPIAGSQSVTLSTPGAPPAQVTTTLSNPVYPILASITPAIGPVAGDVRATVQGAGFDPNNSATSVNFAPHLRCTTLHPCPGTTVPAQAVSSDFATTTVWVPRSPLPLDGSGIARVSAIVNGLESAGIEYLYVVPGKPVLNFAPRLCGGGALTVDVYGTKGSPEQVSVLLTAPYNAFAPAAGTSPASSMTVTSGQTVALTGAGPVTATNTVTSQRVTQTFPVPQLNPCTAGNLLWPSIEGTILTSPGPWVGRVGPVCADCPIQFNHTVLWTPDAALTNPTAFVTIAGRSVSQIRASYSVSSVGAEELNSYVTAGTLAAVQGAGEVGATGDTTGARVAQGSPLRAGLAPLSLLSPVVKLRSRVSKALQPESTKVRVSITFQLPKDAAEASAYHIVHLVRVDDAPQWVEDTSTRVSGHGHAVTVTAEALGVYALAQAPSAAALTAQSPAHLRELRASSGAQCPVSRRVDDTSVASMASSQTASDDRTRK